MTIPHRRKGVGRIGSKQVSRSRSTIDLAGGVELRGSDGSAVLVCPDGDVQLNQRAAAILELCDGSRSREDIIAVLGDGASAAVVAGDINEFLDAARMRGWIIER